MRPLIKILLLLFFGVWVVYMSFNLAETRQAADWAQAWLPTPDDLPGWSLMGPARSASTPEDLFRLINGGAELYLEHGFLGMLLQSYGDDQQRRINLEICRMKTQAAAAALMKAKLSGEEKPLKLGDEARQGGYYVIFRSGPFLVTAVGTGDTGEMHKPLNTLTAKVLQRLEG